MIDRIISFIMYFPDNLHFHFGDYEFFGLCLRRELEFPWVNRKGRNLFLNEFLEHENEEDYSRFIYWYEKWQLEGFHRKLSTRLILHILCYCFLFFCLPAAFAQSNIWVLVVAACEVIFLLAIFLIQKRMSRLYYGLNLVRMAVDILKQNLIEENQSETVAVEFSVENS